MNNEEQSTTIEETPPQASFYEIDSEEEEDTPSPLSTEEHYRQLLHQGLRMFIVGLILCLGSQATERELNRVSPLLFYLIFIVALFCIFRGFNMFLIGRIGLMALRDCGYQQQQQQGEEVHVTEEEGTQGGREVTSEEALPMYTRTADTELETIITHSLNPADLPAYEEVTKEIVKTHR
jgi:hypothetical protein